jgi:hypothetical protein
MGAVNRVVIERICPNCGNLVEFKVQFKYGNVWEDEYRIGDRLRWGRDFPDKPHAGQGDVGKPSTRQVVVYGIAEGCPNCGYSCGPDGELDYEVWVEDDQIVAVRPASGRYVFEREDPYLVLRE